MYIFCVNHGEASTDANAAKLFTRTCPFGGQADFFLFIVSCTLLDLIKSTQYNVTLSKSNLLL